MSWELALYCQGIKGLPTHCRWRLRGFTNASDLQLSKISTPSGLPRQGGFGPGWDGSPDETRTGGNGGGNWGPGFALSHVASEINPKSCKALARALAEDPTLKQALQCKAIDSAFSGEGVFALKTLFLSPKSTAVPRGGCGSQSILFTSNGCWRASLGP